MTPQLLSRLLFALPFTAFLGCSAGPGPSAPASAPPTSVGLLFEEDFEARNFSRWPIRQLCCTHSGTFSDDAAYGQSAARFELRKGDPSPFVGGSKRAEIALNYEPDPKAERWYGFAIKVPADYQPDTIDELVAQWHAKPDAGESYTHPPLSIRLQNGRWLAYLYWDERKIQPSTGPAHHEIIDLGPYRRGEWTDFLLHVKWSSGSDGVLQIWRRDSQGMVEKSRLGKGNMYNNDIGVAFKIGVYKSIWESAPHLSQADKRVLYFDEVRVGDERVDPKVMIPRHR